MMAHDTIIDKLMPGLEPFKLEAQAPLYAHFISLLHKWNKAYNLTAIRDVDDMIPRHIFDSLGILPWVKGRRILDVGTGPGLPGIVLAIAQPEHEITLLDSNGKKTRFLTEVKRQLHLHNVTIVNSRVESYHVELGFDTLTSRAFSELKLFIELTQHLIAPDGQWLAMKGANVSLELSHVLQPYELHTYHIPGDSDMHYCVTLQN